ncbi:MAG TPA: DMT family transporter, partial [Anaerolineales bacterium]
MGLRNGVLFVLMGLIWGSSFAWIKVAIQEIGPFTLVALRLLFGALGGLLILLLYRPPLPRRRAEWLALALVGLTNTAFPFVLISWGEQTVDSSVASVLNSSIPLFTLPIAHFMLADERISARKLVGLLIGFSGVLVLISRDLRLEGLTENMVGQLAILLATLLYAFSGVFV